VTNVYHVTPRRNVRSILKLGLIPYFAGNPSYGGRYGTYFLADVRVARRERRRVAAYRGERCALLRVNLPRYWPLYEDPADYAPACYTPIWVPPWWIEVFR
jgi:hypothetical protein